jgi:hypothetical protein
MISPRRSPAPLVHEEVHEAQGQRISLVLQDLVPRVLAVLRRQLVAFQQGGKFLALRPQAGDFRQVGLDSVQAVLFLRQFKQGAGVTSGGGGSGHGFIPS